MKTRVVSLAPIVVLALSCAFTSALSPPKEMVTTSYKKPLGEVLHANAVQFSSPRRLDDQARTPDGAFILRPGAYELEIPSFCLHAGKGGGAKGTSYVAAALEGPKGAFIKKLVSRAAREPRVNQRELQSLIWAILARAKIDGSHKSYGPTLELLLTEKELADLNEDAIDVIGKDVLEKMKAQMPPEARAVLEAENKLRGQFEDLNTSYEELERTAVPIVGDEAAGTGAWTRTKEGYLIRFFPNGYQSTKVQIVVEGGTSAGLGAGSPFLLAQQPGAGGVDGCTNADLSGMVAAPDDAARQRLLQQPPDTPQAGALREAKTDKQIEKALEDVAKACEERVNREAGYGATNPPPGDQCAKLGTQKHKCAENMINQAANSRVQSEVAYNKDGFALPPQGTSGGDKCRGAYFNDAVMNKGMDDRYKGTERYANCAGYMCADVVMMKEGKVDAAANNVKQAYDFKFPCGGNEPKMGADQLAKYESTFGHTPKLISP